MSTFKYMKLDKIFIFKPTVMYSLTSLVLVVVWFSSGSLLAGGEESFSYFNNGDFMNLNWFWSERGSTGFLTPFETVRLPVSTIVIFASRLGIPFWLSQAAMFFILIGSDRRQSPCSRHF